MYLNSPSKLDTNLVQVSYGEKWRMFKKILKISKLALMIHNIHTFLTDTYNSEDLIEINSS